MKFTTGLCLVSLLAMPARAESPKFDGWVVGEPCAQVLRVADCPLRFVDQKKRLRQGIEQFRRRLATSPLRVWKRRCRPKPYGCRFARKPGRPSASILKIAFHFRAFIYRLTIIQTII
ncbi:MAG: hypothetical protein M1449_13005 [Candidatus Thermoplasmatota archaeon]|nr:hypothetical protein [Candidatus Thermoplasmatota archaeon]